MLQTSLEELKKGELPFYNIFEILNIRTYEEKLHTPFLRELLDPNGSHENGIRFLLSFLELAHAKTIEESDLSSVHIEEEKATELGRIDLFLSYQLGLKDHYLIIENKIYAGDQDKQLERYHSYLTNSLGKSEDQIMLIYLHPNGDLPTSKSIELHLRDRLMKNRVLKLMSYKGDVYSWLEQNYQSILSIPLKFMIRQYLNTLEKL
ncbi:MAG: PD-(D/E)XK nuclease family protein [Bacteroidota bacterium]